MIPFALVLLACGPGALGADDWIVREYAELHCGFWMTPADARRLLSSASDPEVRSRAARIAKRVTFRELDRLASLPGHEYPNPVRSFWFDFRYHDDDQHPAGRCHYQDHRQQIRELWYDQRKEYTCSPSFARTQLYRFVHRTGDWSQVERILRCDPQPP